MTEPVEGLSTANGYVFGHSERELEWLATQARVVDPITRWFLREAGLMAGMRVLDVGSGAGAHGGAGARSGSGPSQRVVPRGRPDEDEVRASVRCRHRALRSTVPTRSSSDASKRRRPPEARRYDRVP